MTPRELFQNVVKLNYDEFLRYPTDIRLLWNALISMNSVAEYLALAELGHRRVSRQALQDVADEMRDNLGLEDLELCADTLKHARKTGGNPTKFSVTATSTGMSSDAATWKINGLIVVDVLKRAFEKLKEHPDLK